MGTLVSISGAMIIIFYKGPSIGTMPLSSTQNTYPAKPSFSTMLPTTHNWVIGGLFIAIASLSAAVSIISQVKAYNGAFGRSFFILFVYSKTFLGTENWFSFYATPEGCNS